MSVLLLDASYEPLKVISTRRAFLLVWEGKADLVAATDGVLRSVRETFPVPAVVRLCRMARVPFSARVPLNRRTLAVRDGGRCQVAGCPDAGTTMDHVVPRSRGGRHEWGNVVLMCGAHNFAKSDRLLSELGWRLRRSPRAPRGLVLAPEGTAVREEWLPYLPAVAA